PHTDDEALGESVQRTATEHAVGRLDHACRPVLLFLGQDDVWGEVNDDPSVIGQRCRRRYGLGCRADDEAGVGRTERHGPERLTAGDDATWRRECLEAAIPQGFDKMIENLVLRRMLWQKSHPMPGDSKKRKRCI